jgi:N-acylglucosamine 2-epimerase
MKQPMTFPELLTFYQDQLFQQVMPFWLNCMDNDNGGINNMVKDNGVIVSKDKILWSQGRALWTFSAIHNRLDQDPKWLKAAHNIAEFLFKNGRDQSGQWVFRIDEDGQIVDPSVSIYVDAFIAYGMTEYSRATGSKEALAIALEIYERISLKLYDHTTLKTTPLPIPEGLQAHGPLMIYALVFFELGLLTQRDDILQEALKLAEKIMSEHVHVSKKCLLEYVRPGGQSVETDAGQTIIPGHAIESMWFLEQIFDYFHKPDKVKFTSEVIRWSLEKGWDDEYGGIFLARHLGNGTPTWFKPDSKVWWPATESLYALLRNYEISGESWCLDWYWRIHEYSFDKYPNYEFGDWKQNLDRQGLPMDPVVSTLQVKDPFHLPRALIYSILSLKRMTS